MSEYFSRALRERVDALQPRIDVDTSHVFSGARRRRTLRRSAVTTVVLTAVVVLVVALSAQPWTSWTSTPPAATPTVPTELVAPEGTYWHTVWEIETDGVVTGRTELWTARTGDGLIVPDGDLTRAEPQATFGLSVRIDGTATTLTWDRLDEIPADPAALDAFARAAFLDDAGDPDTAVLAMLVNIVRSPVSQDVRTAAWTVASGLPGSIVTTGATGSRGQAGTLLERDGSTYLFDPTSGLLLEYTALDARIIYLEQDVTHTLPTG